MYDVNNYYILFIYKFYIEFYASYLLFYNILFYNITNYASNTKYSKHCSIYLSST